MFLIKQLIVVVLIGGVLCQECSLIDNDVLIIIAKPNEQMKYFSTSFFNTVDYKAIQIVDDLGITKLVPPLQKLSQANYVGNVPNIVSVKVLKQNTDQWLNRFAILDKQATSYNIQISKLKQGQEYRIPILTQGILNVANDLLICYDLDFLDNDTIIIDCSQQGDQGAPLSNIIIHVALKDNIVRTEYLGLNPMNYVVTPKRFVSTQDGLIFRGYAYEGLGQLSVIEILYFDEGQFKIEKTIDSAVLAVLLNLDNYEFKLIEMSSSSKYFSILNANGDILILQYKSSTKELRLIYKKSFGKVLTKFLVNYEKIDYIFGADNENIYSTFGQEDAQFAIDMTSSTMHLTKNSLLVRSANKIIQYDRLALGKIDEIDINNQYILTDFLQNDFVIFDTNKISRYSGNILPEIQISYDQVVTKNIIKVTYDGCELQLFYYCISDDSAEVFNTRNPSEFLQSDITIRSTQLTSKQIFEGPNLQYFTSPLADDSIKYSVEQFNILRQNVDFSKVRYVTSLLDWNYIFYQTEDLKGYLLRCNKFSCDPYKSFQFDNELNDQNSFWISNFRLTLYYMAEKEVRQYKDLQDPMTPTAIIAKSEFENTEMVQLDKSTFILLQKNEHIVRQQDMDLVNYDLFALTPTTAIQFGIDNWNPTKIYGNLVSDVFVIESNEQLYVFKFQLFEIWQLLITIPFKYTNVPVDVAIFQKYIVVITQQMKIHVYNIEDQTNIYLQKSINAYKYRFTDKILMTYSYYENLFYVNVVDENQLSKVVVFSADKISHSAIIQVFDVSTPNVVISSLYDQFLLIDNQALQRMKYLSDYYIPIELSTTQESYYKKVNQIIKVKTLGQVKQFEQHFKILNDQREIKINQQNINDGKDKFEVSDDKCMDLPSDWYRGQVESVTAVCPQCDQGNVVFQSYLQQTKQNALDLSQDIVDFNNDELIQLTGLSLYQISKFDLSFSIIHLDQICQTIRSLKNTIFMMCNDVENKNLFIGYQIRPQESTKLGTLAFDEKIRDFRVFNNYLFIEFESSIKIYYFEQGIDDIEKGQLIGTYTQINQVFEVVRLSDNIYYLSFINIQQLYYFELEIKQDKIVENNKFTMNLRNILDDLDGYAATDTIFNGMICTQQKQNPNALYYLFTTSNVAQYVIKFQIQLTTLYLNLISVLSPLGDYQIEGYPKLQVSEDYVIIPYSKYKKQRLSLYNLKDTPQEQGLPIYMRGAVTNNGLTATTLIYGFNGSQYLLAEDEELKTYNQYKLFQNMTLCTNKGVTQQSFYFQLSNSFTNNELNLGIELLSDKSSSLWWLWLILGLICAAAIGIGAYCYLKKRNSRVDDRLIS